MNKKSSMYAESELEKKKHKKKKEAKKDEKPKKKADASLSDET